jgi:hypothetical protein
LRISICASGSWATVSISAARLRFSGEARSDAGAIGGGAWHSSTVTARITA